MNVSDYFRSKLYHPKCPALMSTCRYQSQLGDWHWQKCPHGWCIELMWPEAHPVWPLMTLQMTRLQTHSIIWDEHPYMQSVFLRPSVLLMHCTQTFKWHQIQSEHIGTWTKSKHEKGHLVTWVNDPLAGSCIGWAPLLYCTGWSWSDLEWQWGIWLSEEAKRLVRIDINSAKVNQHVFEICKRELFEKILV